MKTFVFELAEHPEYGSNGWRMVGTNMDPLGGMGVAHDCLEHFGEDNVTVTSELKALGASLFTRADYFSAKGKFETNPGVHIAADVPMILQAIRNGDHITKPPATRPIPCEDCIDKMFSEVRKNWRDECEDIMCRNDMARQFPAIRSWLRVGYRMATRRYRGHSQWDVTNLFMSIEDAADKYLKHAESWNRLVVRVNFKDLTARIDCIEQSEE